LRILIGSAVCQQAPLPGRIKCETVIL